MQFAGAVREAVLAEIVELLRREVEDRSLIVLFGRGKVQGVARAEVQGQAVGELPIVLREELEDVIARRDLALLQIDLKRVDLAEEEAGDGVAAVGYALLIGSGGGERKGAGGIGRRDGVELIPAEIEAELELMRSASVGDVVDCLPDRGLILREGAGGGA